jgi:tetratricopeptide (TPR) repeat protein
MSLRSSLGVNIAFAKLELDYPKSTEERVVALRRNFNAQRRYLANHGEFLVAQIPELTTDIDCAVIAGAFDSHGDYQRAERFFPMAVEKSPNSALKAVNLRGLARFWFRRGNAQRGRKCYEESLQIDLPDTDSMRQFSADTYLLWAKTEEECGFLEESHRVRELAMSAAKRIGHARMRDGMIGQITDAFGLRVSDNAKLTDTNPLDQS